LQRELIYLEGTEWFKGPDKHKMAVFI